MQPRPTLAERYLELNGIAAGLARTIHADDEMFGFIAERVDPGQAELSYMRSGFEVFRSLENALDRCGRPLAGCARVLDFACGWGRLTRFLCRALPPERVWAADIEPSATAFVAERLGVHGVVSTRDADALQLSEEFDLIWVGSLFSHLPRKSFHAWLARLWSMVADNGLLMFSTHGARAAPEMTRDPSGFTFLEVSETKDRLATSDYGTTYVSEATMRAIARELGLPEPGWLEAELWGIQDLWVARRGDEPVPVLEPAPTAFGRIEKAWFPRPGHAWVGGGVRMPVGEGRPTIRLWIDGVDTTECRVSGGHLFPHPGAVCPAMQYFQWYTEGPLESPEGVVRDVAVAAVGASGVSTVFDVGTLTPAS